MGIRIYGILQCMKNFLHRRQPLGTDPEAGNQSKTSRPRSGQTWLNGLHRCTGVLHGSLPSPNRKNLELSGCCTVFSSHL